MSRKQQYTSIEGMKVISAIGILLMHIQANTEYRIKGVFYNNIITNLGDFVFFFMIISSFGICCGYYEKLRNNDISIGEFYSKRFKKLWPFFSLLVCIDLIVNPSLHNSMEGFANITLCFGLLPNAKMEVIGVGWNLGIIFVFYMLFPFIIFIMEKRWRLWLAFAISIIFHLLCIVYFCDETHVTADYMKKTNIIFCIMFFLVGAIIYLYKDYLINLLLKYKQIILVLCLIGTWIYFSTEPEVLEKDLFRYIKLLCVFSIWLIYLILEETKILYNTVVIFLKDINYEIYLSHMFIFRIIEKCGLLYIFGNGWQSYVIVSALVFIGTIIFSKSVKKVGRTLTNSKMKLVS